MKCAELADALERLGDLYRISAEGAPRALSDLQVLVRSVPELTVSQFSKKLDKLRANTDAPGAISADQIPELCDAVASFLKPIGKPAVVKELQQLSVAIKKIGSINPDNLVAQASAGRGKTDNTTGVAVRLDLVQAHLRLLERALGDDVGFTSAFRSLEMDANLGTAEYVSLAKQFSFAATKSKSAALKKIWARHQALMTSRAKAAATAGRIAG